MKMKYIKSALLGALFTVVLFTGNVFAATTNAPSGDLGVWTLQLAGSGGTTLTGNSQSTIGAEIQLGHTGQLVLPAEFGLRQVVGYASADGGSVQLGSKL